MFIKFANTIINVNRIITVETFNTTLSMLVQLTDNSIQNYREEYNNSQAIHERFRQLETMLSAIPHSVR